jgi:hypothetical protein
MDRQGLSVAFGKIKIGTAFARGGDNDPVGRRRLNELQRDKESAADNEQGGEKYSQKIAEMRVPFRFLHGELLPWIEQPDARPSTGGRGGVS